MPSFATDPNHELIAALILEVLRLVEDAAPGLVRTWPVERADQEKRIDELAGLAEALSALGAAATALHRRREINV